MMKLFKKKGSKKSLFFVFFVKNAKNAKNCVFLQKIVEKKQNKTHIKSEGITHVI